MLVNLCIFLLQKQINKLILHNLFFNLQYILAISL